MKIRRSLKDLLLELDRDPALVLQALAAYWTEVPFNPAIEQLLITLSRAFARFEKCRGPVSRADRARLATTAQPYQDLIHASFFDWWVSPNVRPRL